MREADEVSRQQLAMLYAGLPMSQAASIVVAGLLVLVLWAGTASHSALVIWLAAAGVIAAARLFARALWLKAGSSRSLRFWLKLFLVGAFFGGALWGAAGMFLLDFDAGESHLVVILALAGMSAAAVPYLAATMSAFYVFCIPALAPMAFRALAHGEALAINLGITTLLYLVALVIVARRNNATILEALRLRHENGALLQELRSSNENLQRNVALLEGVLNSTADGLLVVDRSGHAVTWNRRFLEMWKIPEAIAATRRDAALLEYVASQVRDPEAFLSKVRDLYDYPERSTRDEIGFSDGRVFARYSIPHQVGGQIVGRVWSFHDITAERDAQHRLAQTAHHDALTGLLNRHLFTERLQEALARSLRQSSKLALLFIDLNGFKQVNDSSGHHTGDAVLAEAARRLRDALRETDLVARLGGDEFVVVIEHLKDYAEATVVAKKTIALLSSPYAVGDAVFVLSASIGISIAPDNGQTMEQLLKSADAAMYRAKRERQGAYEFATAPLPPVT